MPAFYPEGDEPKLADPSGRSLHKINNLLKSIDAKTGSTTITGPVTVSNEVEVTNSTGNPIPVSGTVALDSNSLAALENISVTFPATQNVNVTNAGLSVSVSNLPATQPVSGSVSVSNFPATQPVSLATAPTTPVTGTFWQATQPTRETQPIGDYIINTSSVAAFSASGSALQSASFDAGVNADYVVFTLSGGGSAGAFYYDLSTNNSTWDLGNTSGGFSTYYDLPAASVTDTYSYKSVTATSLFGSTRTSFAGRFIVPLTQTQPGSGAITTYRYIRLNLPASNGGWRYRFASYKSVDAVTGASIPGNPSTTRVTGRVDVGYISNLPALSTGTNTIGSVNVLGGNATAVKVDGSAVTQPVSLASVPSHPVTGSGSFTAAQATAANLNATVVGSGSFTAAQATASNLKAQAQLLNASGSVVDYAMTGTAGTPATDVVTIQGIVGGTNIQVSDKGSTGPTTVTNYTSTTSSVLASANSARKLLTVFNEGVGTLYVLYGAGTASTSNYSVRLNSGDYLEIEKYTGTVTGVFGTAGTARVTEIS